MSIPPCGRHRIAAEGYTSPVLTRNCTSQCRGRHPVIRYNGPVGNGAYLNVWCKEFSESSLPSTLQSFLATVPLSASRPGFTQLIIRAVRYAEPPLVEHDLRLRPLDAAEIAAAAGEILHDDICYEVEAHWDLWSYDAEKKAWRLGPRRLEISCLAERFDDGAWEQSGHFSVDLGFEDLFTGEGNLIGGSDAPAAIAEQFDDGAGHPSEREFRDFRAQPGRLREYQEKTRSNILTLQNWVGRILTALPVAGVRLWSEGEENFEDRVDAILAAG